MRAWLQEDVEQGRAAAKILEKASLVAISLPYLCEIVWVLLRGAEFSKEKALIKKQLLYFRRKVYRRAYYEVNKRPKLINCIHTRAGAPIK